MLRLLPTALCILCLPLVLLPSSPARASCEYYLNTGAEILERANDMMADNEFASAARSYEKAADYFDRGISACSGWGDYPYKAEIARDHAIEKSQEARDIRQHNRAIDKWNRAIELYNNTSQECGEDADNALSRLRSSYSDILPEYMDDDPEYFKATIREVRRELVACHTKRATEKYHEGLGRSERAMACASDFEEAAQHYRQAGNTSSSHSQKEELWSKMHEAERLAQECFAEESTDHMQALAEADDLFFRMIEIQREGSKEKTLAMAARVRELYLIALSGLEDSKRWSPLLSLQFIEVIHGRQAVPGIALYEVDAEQDRMLRICNKPDNGGCKEQLLEMKEKYRKALAGHQGLEAEYIRFRLAMTALMLQVHGVEPSQAELEPIAAILAPPTTIKSVQNDSTLPENDTAASQSAASPVYDQEFDQAYQHDQKARIAASQESWAESAALFGKAKKAFSQAYSDIPDDRQSGMAAGNALIAEHNKWYCDSLAQAVAAGRNVDAEEAKGDLLQVMTQDGPDFKEMAAQAAARGKAAMAGEQFLVCKREAYMAGQYLYSAIEMAPEDYSVLDPLLTEYGRMEETCEGKATAPSQKPTPVSDTDDSPQWLTEAEESYERGTQALGNQDHALAREEFLRALPLYQYAQTKTEGVELQHVTLRIEIIENYLKQQ